MKAKEMFKQLGFNYKKIIVDKDSHFIKCNNQDDLRKPYNITFQLADKTFYASYIDTGEAYEISVNELKAVFQQVKELGWIE